MKIFFKKPEVPYDETLIRVCKNCGNQFTSRYCNKCGEKVIEPYERSVYFFLASVLNAFTFIEGKFFRTLRMVFLKPGFYSKQFTEGVRQPSMRPIAFFFVGNVIYFLFPLFINTFATPLQNQRNMLFYGKYVNEWVLEHVQEQNVSEEEFERTFNTETVAWAKTLLVLIIPLFSVFVTLVNFSRAKFYSDHLTLSAEFSSFLIFCNMIFLPLVLLGVSFLASTFWNVTIPISDNLLLPIISTSLCYFLISAEMKFYEQVWWRAILKGALLYFCFFITLQLYRIILFFTVLWAL